MQEKFKDILTVGEHIIEVIQPNKTKFMFSSFVWSFLCFDLAVMFGAILLFIQGMFLSGLITLVCLILVLLLILVWCNAYYRTCYYAVTNKRIIIRSGVFGVDFKTFEITSIGGLNVEVTLIDKLVGKNTGSIYFLSKNAPTNAEYAGNIIYKFSHIQNPYEFYKKFDAITSNLK